MAPNKGDEDDQARYVGVTSPLSESLEQEKFKREKLASFVPSRTFPSGRDPFRTELRGTEKSSPNPHDQAGVVSRMTIWWMNGLLWLGSKRPLAEEDVWPVPFKQQAEYCTVQFLPQWEAYRASKFKAGRFMRALFGSTTEFLWGGAAGILIFSTVELFVPYFVRALVTILSGGSASLLGLTDGYAIAGLLVALNLFSCTAVCQGFTQMTKMGLNVRNTAMDAVYRKALLLSSAARTESTVGEMVTLMSVDAERLFQAFLLCHWLWASPIVAVIGMILLVRYIGVAGLAGVAVLIFVALVQLYIARWIGVIRERVVVQTQERVKLISEAMQGIRVMKFSAWESAISKRVEHYRDQELKSLKLLRYIEACNLVLLFVSPVLIIAATFLSFVARGGELTVTNVFTTISFINVLRFATSIFPHSVACMMEGWVSARRLEKFLLLGELEMRKSSSDESLLPGSIRIVDATFSWEDSSTSGSLDSELEPTKHLVSPSAGDGQRGEPANACFDHSQPYTPVPRGVLSGVNLHIEPGSLVAIVGPVGAGKTSLLQGILGQMHQLSGRMDVKGEIAYVSQDPWIQHATLRENILFEQEYDRKLYTAVVDAAQLRPDLQILPAGDQTEIGERGINLSGGQKARVSLARALYRRERGDIFLFDDPLSACDARVSMRIFEKAIQKLLKNKTRLLVLNSHYHLLKDVDKVILIENGKIVAVGTPADLERKHPAYFATSPEEEELVSEKPNSEREPVHDNPYGRTETTSTLSDAPIATVFIGHHSDNATTDGRHFEALPLSPRSAELSGVFGSRMESHALGKEEAALHKAEEKEEGAVTFATYFGYFRAAGRWGEYLGVVVLFGFVLSQVSRVMTDWWLAAWAQRRFGFSEQSTYIIIYCSLALATACLSLFRSLFLIHLAMKISKNIHHQMLQCMLRAPITTFFDVTPVGRILNRFSKDMDQMDSYLPDYVIEFLQNALTVVGLLAVSCLASPYIILVLLPVLICFLVVDRFFRKSSREVKRLESITRTPIFSSFSETLSGISTIRAFGLEQSFLDKNRAAVNANTRHFFAYWLASRWLSLRLDYLSSLVTLIVAFFSLSFIGNGENAGIAALALSYSLQLTGLLQWTVRNSIMVENSMTSTERILHYTNVPSEAEYQIEETAPSPSWPERGVIEFKNAYMRYRPELDLVLKGLSFTIRSQEKIGICGRTGAGKSSIMMALFRIVELEGGSIEIDGVDISRLGLYQLRSKLAIIPQDPVMFCGSLRENIDPFSQYSDEEIWESLRRVHLASEVASFPLKLQAPVAQGGENLSVGQRQLVCIARALLKKTKVLVMDEATASVDTGTDQLIQETIRQNFADRTVLCIAHRLETIMDSDRIAVISNGTVQEFDAPSLLLEREDSGLTSLLKELGDDVFERMRAMAVQADRKRRESAAVA